MPESRPRRARDSDLELMLFIRHFELALLELFSTGQLSGTTHTCIGQEYIPVALSELLEMHDFVFSTHRGHGHYLARTNDPASLLAEIMGRKGGICSGVGGTQHLYGSNFLSTGVQGQSVSVAAGVAMHLKRHSPGSLSLAFIGDGTWGQGAVYEALNIARLWRLPLVIVVENNGIAQSTPTCLQLAGSIAGRAHAFDCSYRYTDSIDVNEIRRDFAQSIVEVRKTNCPLILEFKSDRVGPHSKGDDTRSPDEIELVRSRDWYRAYREDDPERFCRLEQGVRDRLATLVAEVASRPLAEWCSQ